MIVYNWNGYEIQELNKYIKETNRFFIEANGSRDAKETSYSFKSTNKQDVIDYIIHNSNSRVENIKFKIENFEEKKNIELEYLKSSLSIEEQRHEKLVNTVKETK